jgi:ABC-type transport system substrate-binding protein
MGTRTVLLGLPLVVVALLLQAWWWVPTYDSQLQHNAARARTFIEGSSGDAKLLNPILNSDTASSRITDLVFDGLLKLDEGLNLAPALAQKWRLYEWAYVVPRTGETAAELAVKLNRLRNQPPLAHYVQAIQVVAPDTRIVSVTAPATAGGKPKPVDVMVRLPSRVRIELNRVHQDLARDLQAVLGVWDADAFRASLLAQPPQGVDLAVVAADIDKALAWLEHNPVLEFELRDGVRFHDGHAVDAGDVRFTYDAIMAGRNLSPRRADFEPILALEALSARHIRVTYKRLHSPALFTWTMGILPEHLLNDDAREQEMTRRDVTDGLRAAFGMRDFAFNRAPIGNGPFRFKQWLGDELVELVANPDYWEGPGQLERYYFRVIPDLLTQELEFRSGALDTYAPQPHQVERYRQDERFLNFSTPQRGYSYIAYNLRKAPFDDVRVRRALTHAIDVDMIMRYVLYGEGERVTGPYPPSAPWTDGSLKPPAFDLVQARELLAAAGYAPGEDGWLYKEGKRLEFNLITNNGNPVRKAILTIVQDNWRRIGVKCNTQVFEWAVFLEDFVNPGTFDALVLGWRLGVDPDQYQLWHSSQTGFAQLNFTGLKEARIDALLERIRREYDQQSLRKLTAEFHREIAALAPYTFLFAPRATRVLDRKWRMRDARRGLVPVRPGSAGELFYHMRLWRKTASAALAADD